MIKIIKRGCHKYKYAKNIIYKNKNLTKNKKSEISEVEAQLLLIK